MIAPALAVRELEVCYGHVSALQGVSIEVPDGGMRCLIGANGAGKSTTLRAISGLVAPASGDILFRGEPIGGLPAHAILAKGIAQVPEGRMIFPELTVQENLRTGAYTRRDNQGIRDDMDFALHLFPRLRERLRQMAGTLSGGEQQMLAISRSIMTGARFLMLDEPSLGIAPMLVETIFERLTSMRRERSMTLLLVEQNASLALEHCEYGYVLEAGKIVLEGSAETLRKNPEVQEAYLGGT